MITSSDLRKKYIEFFKKRGHKEIQTVPLLAENDPSLLFVNSGMFPLVPYLAGQSHPQGKRLVNCQRSFRAEDIDEIGDHRHDTFFEMLGNWSLGDYFKKEQLNWLYEFLVEELKLNPDKLYQTVFAGDESAPRDDESIAILQDIFKKYGISAKVGLETTGKGELGTGKEIKFGGGERIFPYRDKNWWKRGDAVGELGGPDSETFYDTGRPHNPKFGKFCHLNCDCGRFIEIGNSVFMEYIKTARGWEKKLPRKNVDFGGGLERILMVANGKANIFETDLFDYLIAFLEKKSGKKYGEHFKSFEIIADHMRAATFLIADGGTPSNKEHGYTVRRLIRRSLVHLRKLEVDFSEACALAKLTVEHMKDAYPYLKTGEEGIVAKISAEVDKFSATLAKGIGYFEKIKPVKNIISGADVFNLFTTYGFPVELTREMAKEKGYEIDAESFGERFKAHQELSRRGAEQKFKGGLADMSEQTTKYHTATHLLLAALREVFGEHIYQRGSNITAERLRFDFSHPEKLTKEQVQKVEDLVNEQIRKNLPVAFTEMNLEDAKRLGAMGIFEAKYGERVKVYTIGDEKTGVFSREICGGPHVKNTSVLGKFKIKKEEAISAGVRRIKAVLV